MPGRCPKFIETPFYAKMPTHLKRILNQSRLETESYDMMVQNLERETELNETNITGVHQNEVQETQQAQNRQAYAMDADNLAMLSRSAKK